ncbi:hypothetical protein BH24BAC1_BH24BAC1_27930 [soil metagenome]
MRMSRAGTLLLLLLYAHLGWSQVPEAPAVPLPDTIRTETIKGESIKPDSQNVVQSIRRYSQRDNLLAKLLRSVLVFDDKKQVGHDTQLLTRVHDQHNYKVVRSIEIRTLNAFGYSIHDTTRVPETIFEKVGNSLHLKTRRNLIRNKLLFREGQTLEPLTLSESERLLRQTEYLLDARVLVNENTSTDDSVDVFILTKDIFSIGGSGSYTPPDRGRLSLNDVNFLGQGHQIRNNYYFGRDPFPYREKPVQSWGYWGSYAVENIRNTFVRADFHYRNEYVNKQYGVNLHRDFYATNTKYAGAAALDWFNQTVMVAGDTNRIFDVKYSVQDIWLGRSYETKSYDLGYDNRGRFVTAARAVRTNYAYRSADFFQNNVLFLGSVGYSFRKYYRDQYLFGFGRTEDVPAGNLTTLTFGFQNGSQKNRRYVGLQTAFGRYATDFGYLYAGAEYGTFIHNKRMEQGEISAELLYFTRLWSIRDWQWRQFLWNRMSYGVNRLPNEALFINHQDGIRGFRAGTVTGTKRYVLNYESNLYTPFSFFGFRLAGVLFADLAWIAPSDKRSHFSVKPYQGYGVGLRFRNEYLSFSTIQILLNFYPRVPDEGMGHWRFFQASRPYYDFHDFRFQQPMVTEFR